MKKYILPALFALTILLGCGQKKDGTPSSDTKTGENKQTQTDTKVSSDVLVLTPKEFVKSFNNCQPSDSCAYFKINYLEATSGKIKDKLNAFIGKNVIMASTMGDTEPASMEAAADDFISSYTSSRKDYPDMPVSWFWNYTMQQYGETPKILCLSGESSSFMGGAHPNSFVALYNFDKETGDTISLNDMLVAGFETKLNKMIDHKFRKMMNIAADESLMDKGGLFENKIEFTYNVGVDSYGNLLFYYNPYEIAPYAVGRISIKIGKADLGDLVNPKGPLF